MTFLVVCHLNAEWRCPRCGGRHTVRYPGGAEVDVYTAGCKPVLMGEGRHHIAGVRVPVPPGLETTPLLGTPEYDAYWGAL